MSSTAIGTAFTIAAIFSSVSSSSTSSTVACTTCTCTTIMLTRCSRKDQLIVCFNGTGFSLLTNSHFHVSSDLKSCKLDVAASSSTSMTTTASCPSTSYCQSLNFPVAILLSGYQGCRKA